MIMPGEAEIVVGVLLEPATDQDVLADDELDETGHAPAWGERGRHAATKERRVARLGQEVLVAAAHAVGREVALVVDGIVAGIERPAPNGSTGGLHTSSFAIDNLELTFGVKATLGAGKAVEALLTATGEATVEVKLTLRRGATESR
jgi:hypothetical protein